MLKQRIATALVLAAVALLSIFALPTWAMATVFALALLVGAWEWAGFGGWPQRARLCYTAAMALIMLIISAVSGDPGAVIWVMIAGVIWWLAALVWLFRFPTPVPAWLIVLGGMCVILPAWLALTYLHGRQPLGRFLVFLVLVTVWCADVGAYFIGSRLGRVKLAPRVSPGKTWEGVAGGILAAGAGTVVLCVLVDVSWLTLLPVALVAAGVSVVGDLTVSMFKRNAGLKDSGSVFPGHGGVMDRFDSMAAAAPVFVLGITLMELGR